MAAGTEVGPFRGLRFDWRRVPLGKALCPPYDVIDPELARRLRRGPMNAVHVELPEGEGLGRYRAAAAVMRRWQAEGIVAQDPEPCFYVVEQSFRTYGRRLRRRGFLGALGLASSARAVPHERTFLKPKQDRLRLLSAVRANTSPIFLMYEDPSHAVRRILDRACRGRPAAQGLSPDGTWVRVWRLAEAGACEALSRALAPKILLVADGHHRLEVAREHWRRSGRPGGGAVLAYFCAEEDPGLVVFPTHRVVTDRAWARRLAGKLAPEGELARECRLERMGSVERLLAALAARRSPLSFGVHGAARDVGRMAALVTPSPASARPFRSGLGVEWIQAKLLAGAPPGGVRYAHGLTEALRLAKEASGLAVLVPALDVAGIRRAVRRVGLLPQKTTYFFPKIGAGIVFRAV